MREEGHELPIGVLVQRAWIDRNGVVDLDPMGIGAAHARDKEFPLAGLGVPLWRHQLQWPQQYLPELPHNASRIGSRSRRALA